MLCCTRADRAERQASMGEALARFRDLALAVRRKCDERHSQPRGRAVSAAAASEFAWRCSNILSQHEKAGMPDPESYVLRLCQCRDAAEFDAIPSRGHEYDLPDYIEWLPDPKEPTDSEWKAGLRAAVREAVRWGSLFAVVEARITDLGAATEMLCQFAAADYYCDPTPGEWNESDQRYATEYKKFAEAIDALAPFIEEPPAASAPISGQKTGDKQKKRRDRKGIGGRKKKYPDQFVRDVLAARKREERACRKSKDRLQPKNEWLRLYCRNRDIDTATMFPSEDETAPEPWDERANRFWKAVAAREQRAGN